MINHGEARRGRERAREIDRGGEKLNPHRYQQTIPYTAIPATPPPTAKEAEESGNGVCIAGHQQEGGLRRKVFVCRGVCG